MDATGGIENSVHATNDVKFFVFSFAFQDVETYNEMLVIKMVWMYNELYRTLMMSQC